MVTFHHHIADALLQVGTNIVVQQIPLSFLSPAPRHKLSKLLHNVAVTYLLVEAHSGMDRWWMSSRLFPSVFGGSVRHQLHHVTGKAYMQQFLMYLDDAEAARQQWLRGAGDDEKKQEASKSGTMEKGNAAAAGGKATVTKAG